MDIRAAKNGLRRARAGVHQMAGRYADPAFALHGHYRRRHWAAASRDGKGPHDVFAEASDRWWLWAHTRGSRAFSELRALLPELPSKELQEEFTGSSGDRTLTEGWYAYRLFRETYRSQAGGRGLDGSSRVLDFGCGWGRTVSYFTKDLPPSSLYGVDANPEVINFCLQSNQWATFETNNVLPPIRFEDSSFDLIYGYSVFSHLSMEAHKRWLDEFFRILKPGGLLMVTTWPRRFIEHCEWLRTSASAEQLPASHRVSGGAFVDTAAALAAYDRGEFCFSYRQPSDPEHFGEACIPEQYVRRQWSDRFELVEYLDDPQRCSQNLIVARRLDRSDLP